MFGFAVASFLKSFRAQPVAVRAERLRGIFQLADPAVIASVREALPPNAQIAFDSFVVAVRDWN
jgi:hypothetical protein